MKINKYLEELGLTQNDMMGYYDPTAPDDCAASDPRNEVREDGFCEREFFSLDYTLSIYIYSRLCYFRDNCAEGFVPGCLVGFCGDAEVSDLAQKKWLEILDKMCRAFQIKIKGYTEGYEGLERAEVDEGMHYFVEYYDCLWT